MSTHNREDDLVEAAVRFLRDPKVERSPLAEKMAFLVEKKGLSEQQVLDAFQQLNKTTTKAHAEPPAAHHSKAGWRDYVAGVLVTGSLGYGILSFLDAHLPRWFPTEATIQEERHALDQHLQQSSQQLAHMQESVDAQRVAVEAQGNALQDTVQKMESSLRLLQEAHQRREEEWSAWKQEWSAMQQLLPKTVETIKASQTKVLLELETELKSLKALWKHSQRSRETAASGEVAVTSPAHLDTNGEGVDASVNLAQLAVDPALEDSHSVSLDSSHIDHGTTLPTLPAWQLQWKSTSNTSATNAASPAATCTDAVHEEPVQ